MFHTVSIALAPGGGGASPFMHSFANSVRCKQRYPSLALLYGCLHHHATRGPASLSSRAGEEKTCIINRGVGRLQRVCLRVRALLHKTLSDVPDTDTEPAQICGCSCVQGPGVQTDNTNTNTHFALENAFLVIRSGECRLRYQLCSKGAVCEEQSVNKKSSPKTRVSFS